MTSLSRVVLAVGLSDENFDSVRTYLHEFAYGRCTYEFSNGGVAILLHDDRDVTLIRAQFSSIIEETHQP